MGGHGSGGSGLANFSSRQKATARPAFIGLQAQKTVWRETLNWLRYPNSVEETP